MSNRLADATSPYLRQHAGNPVDWEPWGDIALQRARSENKPILLSIGYSACHWCHVMAHESFEDPGVAAQMNARFVNIKVDREERPDLDQIYQTAHALLTRRSGGWPLTMFLTPTGDPYYAGTYFPKQGRYGLPGFADLLPRLADAYAEQGQAIAEQSRRLADAMNALEPSQPSDALPARAPGIALAALKRSFDPVHGGFGGAPKFPHTAELELCLREFSTGHDHEALRIVRTTLEQMADGGIHDQLGGGFCRYSVDAEWSIPHFEKMLYDNAALVGLYADAARVIPGAGFDDVARDIVDWLVREMRASDGALYSSLDADSEGEEGRFYVWEAEDVRGTLTEDEWALARRVYGLDGPPNFEGRAWHLRIARKLTDVASELRLDAAAARQLQQTAMSRLLARREERVRPARDDKILTSWNALAIVGLNRAGRALEDERIARLARDALDTLRRTAWREHRLYAVRGAGAEAAELPAYLDDHAFLLAALLETMQGSFRREDWDFAIELADALLGRFEDTEHGGFWFTSHDHEKLFHRSKPGHDHATPSGNGVAAQALIAFGALAGEQRYVDAAQRALRVFAPMLADAPASMSTLLTALQDLESPPTAVILDGDVSEARAWQSALHGNFRPTVRVFNIAGADSVPLSLRKGPLPVRGAVAWVCRGTHCLPPLTSLGELQDELAA